MKTLAIELENEMYTMMMNSLAHNYKYSDYALQAEEYNKQLLEGESPIELLAQDEFVISKIIGWIKENIVIAQTQLSIKQLTDQVKQAVYAQEVVTSIKVDNEEIKKG